MLTESPELINHRIYLCWNCCSTYCNHVDFEIHAVAGLQVRQIGDFPGFGNNRDLEVIVFQVCNGQTDALDRNQSL